MYELKRNGKVFTSKSVGTGPSSCEKRIYRAAVSHRLRNTALDHHHFLFFNQEFSPPSVYEGPFPREADVTFNRSVRCFLYAPSDPLRLPDNWSLLL